MTVLLKEAVAQPGADAGRHAGLHPRRPFANIAHGCNSVLATTTALKPATMW
jgi:formyltetrahydrofolate synthetase